MVSQLRGLQLCVPWPTLYSSFRVTAARASVQQKVTWWRVRYGAAWCMFSWHHNGRTACGGLRFTAQTIATERMQLIDCITASVLVHWWRLPVLMILHSTYTSGSDGGRSTTCLSTNCQHLHVIAADISVNWWHLSSQFCTCIYVLNIYI